MALKFADLIRQYSTTIGTGPLVFTTTPVGFKAFSTAMATGDTCYYSIVNLDKPAEVENGLGTMNVNGTLARTPYGPAVNFSAGKKQVSLTVSADFYNQLAAMVANPGHSNWGNIGGLIANQTDLITALAAKADNANLASLTALVSGKVDSAGLSELIDGRVAALLASGSGIALAYDDAANQLTITNTGGGGSTPPPPPPPPPPPLSPTINSAFATGVKRQGETIWLAIDADSTANKYKFEIQANGAPVSGISVIDNGTALVTDFPYQTISPEIQLVVPTALIGVTYALNAYASSNAGSSYSASSAFAEDFTFQSDFFTPAVPDLPVITRLTGSGVVPVQMQIACDLYDSDGFLFERYNSIGSLQDSSTLWASEAALATPFTIDTSGATDPVPTPPMVTPASTDFYEIRHVSADYMLGMTGIVQGVTSAAVRLDISDAVGPMAWSASDNAAQSGSTLTISGAGNLIVSQSGSGTGGIRANRNVAFDLSYWEMTDTGFVDGVFDDAQILTTLCAATVDGGTPTTHGATYYSINGGQYQYNDAPRGDVGWTNTDIRRFWLDRVNNKLWVGKNNTCFNGVPGVSGGLAIPGLANFKPAAQLANGQSTTLILGDGPGLTTGFNFDPNGISGMTGGFVSP